MRVTVDVETVSDAGTRLTTVGRSMPEPVRVPGGSAGDQVVDEAVHDFLVSMGHCLVGAATTLHALGQGARGAAQQFVDADRVMEGEPL
mgnify:CR=1 FL=1